MLIRVAFGLLLAFAARAQTAALPKGLDHFYNLEYDQAIEEFRRRIQAEPGSPEEHNHLAMAILYREMFRSGALETELVSGGNPFLRRPRMNPSAQDQQEFDQAIRKSMDLCRARLKARPADLDAMYALGVAHGLRANYNFLVRKAYLDALRDVTAARKLHNQVTDRNPSRIDARLVQGVHDYVVGSLPLRIRLLGFVAGFRGDKRQGIATLEDVAKRGELNRVDAEVLLCAIYRRERQPARAAPLLEDLISRFPRNFLFRFELAQMYADLGKKDSALAALLEIEKRKSEGEPGYRLVPIEKILYARGVVQFWYNDLDEAARNLERAASAAGELDLNTGTFAWLRLGQTYDLKGQRSHAVAAYQQAVRLAPDSDAARQSRQYLASPYRRTRNSG